jgi:hypothetical protein
MAVAPIKPLAPASQAAHRLIARRIAARMLAAHLCHPKDWTDRAACEIAAALDAASRGRR